MDQAAAKQQAQHEGDRGDVPEGIQNYSKEKTGDSG